MSDSERERLVHWALANQRFIRETNAELANHMDEFLIQERWRQRILRE